MNRHNCPNEGRLINETFSWHQSLTHTEFEAQNVTIVLVSITGDMGDLGKSLSLLKGPTLSLKES